MRRIDVETKQIREVARLIGYRKRKAVIVVSDKVTLSNLNWSGGSRDVYTAINLGDGTTSTPNLGVRAPWDNPHEGATVEIPDGVAIAQHGTFMGKPGLLFLYVRPDNMPKVLPET